MDKKNMLHNHNVIKIRLKFKYNNCVIENK